MSREEWSKLQSMATAAQPRRGLETDEEVRIVLKESDGRMALGDGIHAWTLNSRARSLRMRNCDGTVNRSGCDLGSDCSPCFARVLQELYMPRPRQSATGEAGDRSPPSHRKRGLREILQCRGIRQLPLPAPLPGSARHRAHFTGMPSIFERRARRSRWTFCAPRLASTISNP